MKKINLAIIIVIFVTLFTSLAQLSYKYGLNNIPSLNIAALTNPYALYVLLGLVLYGIGAVMLINALRFGEVTVLYPIIATSYIWVSLLSYFFLKEAMNMLKLAGVFIIIAGIITITKGSKQKKVIEMASEVV